ncbi:MAG: transposase family protein [Planctomycetota bacterium]
MTEEAPWASSDSRFTWELEEMTAYLARITDRTTVTKMMGVAWRTVGRIVQGDRAEDRPSSKASRTSCA